MDAFIIVFPFKITHETKTLSCGCCTQTNEILLTEEREFIAEFNDYEDLERYAMESLDLPFEFADFFIQDEAFID